MPTSAGPVHRIAKVGGRLPLRVRAAAPRAIATSNRRRIISHDRFVLDRIATHMLAFEGDAHVELFEGNFADDEDDKKRRLGVEELIPHRMKHKTFAR